MPNTIFFSWQSITDSKFNRNAISTSLKAAIKKISKSKEHNYHYDEATRTQIGSVDIVDSLFEKIKTSTVFVADITTINSVESGRKTPSPNVLLELGFASSILGWNNIILLFNLAHGDLQDVPFDIRNHRIMTYTFDGDNREGIIKTLTKDFEDILKQMDIDEVRKRDAINRAFAGQTNRVRFLALHNQDDEYWTVKLWCELLNEELETLKHEYDLVQKGIIFNPPKPLGAYDFFKVMSENVSNQRRYIAAFKELFENRLIDSINSFDSVEILRHSQTVARISKNLIDFEVERRSFVVHEELEQYRRCLGTNVTGYITMLEKFIAVMSKLPNDKADKILITADDIDPVFNVDSNVISEITLVIQRVMVSEASQPQI